MNAYNWMLFFQIYICTLFPHSWSFEMRTVWVLEFKVNNVCDCWYSMDVHMSVGCIWFKWLTVSMVIAVAKRPMSQQKQPCLKTGQVKIADSVNEKNNQVLFLALATIITQLIEKPSAITHAQLSFHWDHYWDFIVNKRESIYNCLLKLLIY